MYTSHFILLIWIYSSDETIMIFFLPQVNKKVDTYIIRLMLRLNWWWSFLKNAYRLIYYHFKNWNIQA